MSDQPDALATALYEATDSDGPDERERYVLTVGPEGYCDEKRLAAWLRSPAGIAALAADPTIRNGIAPLAETLRIAAVAIEAYDAAHQAGEWYLDAPAYLRSIADRDDVAEAWAEFRRAAKEAGALDTQGHADA